MSVLQFLRQPQGSDTSIITELNDNDVLQGRGALIDRFPGNVRFRAFVRARKVEYSSACLSSEKCRIANEIIRAVHGSQGRFLRRVSVDRHIESTHGIDQNHVWHRLSETATMDKVKQALRDISRNEPKAPPSKSDGPRNTEQTSSATEPLAGQGAANLADQVSLHGSARLSRSALAGESPIQAERSTVFPSTEAQSTPAQARSTASQVPLSQLDLGMHRSSETPSLAALRYESPLDPNLRAGGRSLMEQTALPHAAAPFTFAPTAQGTYSGTSAIVPPVSWLPRSSSTHVPSQSNLGRVDDENLALRMLLSLHEARDGPPEQQPPPHVAMAPQLAGSFGNVFNGLPSAASVSAPASARPAPWRDIPAVYEASLPLMQQPTGPPFTSQDLSILLSAQSQALVAGDIVCLARIQRLFESLLSFPTPQLHLTSQDIQRLLGALWAP